MMKKNKWLDLASSLTLIVTLVLFVIAVFEKGFTHDLLLEAGVFLVSVKLVLGARKNELMLEALGQKIDQLTKK
jgi:hypothetical protein